MKKSVFLKKTASLILCLTIVLSSLCLVHASSELARYSDISDIETAVAAATLTGLGVTDGTGNGMFSPNQTLTRAEACKLMVLMMGLGNKVSSYAKKTVFSDVKGGMWYTGYVNLANAQGIVNGYGNGKFGPEDTITYGQLATMIIRMLGYKTSDIGSLWPLDYTDYAEEIGLSDNLELDPYDGLTRSDAAILFYRSLGAANKNNNKPYYNSLSAVANASNGLLYNASGDVIGFAADSENYADVTIASAPARVFYNASGQAVYTFMASSNAKTTKQAAIGYMVQGYISAASPSVSAATTITVAGYTFNVSSSGRSALSGYKVGSKVTLILGADLKVEDVKSSSYSCEMIGVLSSDKKSITLAGSGIKLSATNIKGDTSLSGSLVSISMTAMDTISCSRIATGSGTGGKLDIENRTYKGKAIAADCSIYEWAGSGYVYSLEGDAGKYSSDFSAIFWTDCIETAYASYTHTDENGEIDILLFNDLTGNGYQYGEVSIATNGISVNYGSALGSESYDAAVLANSKGSTKAIYTIDTASGYMGLALGKTNYSNEKVTKIKTLKTFSFWTGNVGNEATSAAPEMYTKDNSWYVLYEGMEYPINDNVEIFMAKTEKWTSGSNNLSTMLSDGYNLVMYYDALPQNGGQVRIIKAY